MATLQRALAHARANAARLAWHRQIQTPAHHRAKQPLFFFFFLIAIPFPLSFCFAKTAGIAARGSSVAGLSCQEVVGVASQPRAAHCRGRVKRARGAAYAAKPHRGRLL